MDSGQDGRRPSRMQDCVVIERQSGSALVVSATGTVDMLTAPLLGKQISESLAKTPTVLIVDLTEVEFLATAGLEVLIIGHRAAQPDVRFAVVADGPATSRPMKITGITDLIDLFASLEEALAGLPA